MPSETTRRLAREVMLTADTFLRESQRLFRPLGLTAAQYNVLTVLAESGRGLSQRELSEALVVDRSNITGLIDRMEKAGWVRREDDPTDRRVYRVLLTAAGRRLWGEVHPLYLEVASQVCAGLTERQMSGLLTGLARMREGAERWQLE